MELKEAIVKVLDDLRGVQSDFENDLIAINSDDASAKQYAEEVVRRSIEAAEGHMAEGRLDDAQTTLHRCLRGILDDFGSGLLTSASDQFTSSEYATDVIEEAMLVLAREAPPPAY